MFCIEGENALYKEIGILPFLPFLPFFHKRVEAAHQHEMITCWSCLSKGEPLACHEFYVPLAAHPLTNTTKPARDHLVLVCSLVSNQL